MNKAGYKHILKYQSQANSSSSSSSSKRTRSRQQTWFNPPFSKNVKTNVSADFLKAVDKSFPKGHPLRPIFNRNTIKTSYKTTGNMAEVISRHNKKLSQKSQKKEEIIKKDCNCQKANLPCVMNGKCVPGCVIYQGAVTRHDTGVTDYYTGLSEPSWKLRWGNHKQNFKTDTKSNRTATCLAGHIWKLKDKNISYSIKFKQLAQAPAFNPVTGICRLCLTESYFIMFHLEGANINSRTEFFSACRHKSKLLLVPPAKKT